MRWPVKTLHANFKDDKTIYDRTNPESIEAVHADFKDYKMIDDKENPERIEDDASDYAENDESNIQDKAETDDGDAMLRRRRTLRWRRKRRVKKRIKITCGVY